MTTHKRSRHTTRPCPPTRLFWPCRSAAAGATGSVTVELVLLTPLLLLVMLFIVTGARLASAKLRVSEAATTASRTASLTRTPTEAAARARATARQALTGAGPACARVSTSVNTGRYRPGGMVTVTVTCTTSLTDLPLLHLSGTTAVTAHARSPIDRWRGTLSTGRPTQARAAVQAWRRGAA